MTLTLCLCVLDSNYSQRDKQVSNGRICELNSLLMLVKLRKDRANIKLGTRNMALWLVALNLVLQRLFHKLQGYVRLEYFFVVTSEIVHGQ